jgi:hypothetical protein
LPEILGQGVDPEFDALFVFLAQISKKLPKLVIDLAMRWRKGQNDGIPQSAVRHASSVFPIAIIQH